MSVRMYHLACVKMYMCADARKSFFLGVYECVYSLSVCCWSLECVYACVRVRACMNYNEVRAITPTMQDKWEYNISNKVHQKFCLLEGRQVRSCSETR